MKKILIIGSGGREHAFGWKMAQNVEISNVYYAPGNGGTLLENKGTNISIDGTKKENFDEIFKFIKQEYIDLVLVGPEVPLVEGIVDYLNTREYYRVFGPTKQASLLESDKFFSFDLMKKLKIPQAESIKCYTIEEAKLCINNADFLSKNGIVIKARGLTAGKGVSVCETKKQALDEIELHSSKFGQEVLIAERLIGDEFSIFGISDGTKVYPFQIAFKDHKRLLDNEKGPNTGGMGAYCPVANISKYIITNISDRILTPIINELKKTGMIYKGFIYAGMIMTKDGPKVLEFNVRFGDPECQPAMMMIEDLYSLLSSVLDGREPKISIKSGAACCIVLAARGYPGDYTKGLPIEGLDSRLVDEKNKLKLKNSKNIKVFHAGTKKEGNIFVSNGGRILGVTCFSPNNIEEARDNAYDYISNIKIPGGFEFRKDIASKPLQYEEK